LLRKTNGGGGGREADRGVGGICAVAAVLFLLFDLNFQYSSI